jgi:hypothetical protein
VNSRSRSQLILFLQPETTARFGSIHRLCHSNCQLEWWLQGMCANTCVQYAIMCVKTCVWYVLNSLCQTWSTLTSSDLWLQNSLKQIVQFTTFQCPSLETNLVICTELTCIHILQVAFLRSLGCTKDPKTMMEASTLIEQFKKSWKSESMLMLTLVFIPWAIWQRLLSKHEIERYYLSSFQPSFLVSV